MALNTEHLGIPIAMIMVNDGKTKTSSIISLDDSEKAKNPFNELKLQSNQIFKL